MKSMNFDININAPRENVWKALWEDANYRAWTAPFAEGSHAVTDWKQGSKVLFLNEKGEGMVSRIEENRPNEYMSIRHLGEMKDGVEDVTSETAEQWANAMENYTLSNISEGTHLKIELTGNIPPEFEGYFAAAWPKALNILKGIAEKN